MEFEMFSQPDGDRVVVEAGSDTVAADGEVRLFAPATERMLNEGSEPLTLKESQEVGAVVNMSPSDARTLAAALLRAADEAEGTDHLAQAAESARKHDDALYAEDALPFAEPMIVLVRMLVPQER
jgi:hypothetical protein